VASVVSWRAPVTAPTHFRAARSGSYYPDSDPTRLHRHQRDFTEMVHKQVIRNFKGRKAIVLATLHGQELPQSKRTSQRRRSQ
jgi:hypothetical protein